MGKQGAEARRALHGLPGSGSALRLGHIGALGYCSALGPCSMGIQPHCTAWALSPSPCVMAATDLDGDPFPRYLGCHFIPALAPTGEPCQLPLKGLPLKLVRQAMEVVRNLPLSNLSCSQLCLWLCPEPGWDARLLERRYGMGGGQLRPRLTNPTGIQTQMQP